MNDHPEVKQRREPPAPAELRTAFAVFATLALCAYAYTMHTYGTDDWGRVARIIRILRRGEPDQPMVGLWTTPSFNASDFSAADRMKRIVEPADVQTYASTIIGKTQTVNFLLIGTSVEGTPSSERRISVPGGARIARRTITICMVNDGLTGWTQGTLEARNGGSILYVYKGLGGTGINWSPSKNAT